MQQYLVGLYHGEESGHLVVHCNNSVILIDFGVKQSKDYSFFLEEELFELRLTQSNGRFSYQFIHNEKADTPRNRRQAMEAKTDRWRMVALAVMVVIFFGFWAVQYRSAPASLASQRAALAAGRGVTTTVHIYQEKDRWFAAYQVGSQVREIILPAKDTLSGLGFQLVEGDQFAARYAEKSPTVLHIEWGEVSPAQQARYLVATMNRHRTLHPELSVQQVRCQVELALALEGLAGVAKIHQQASADFPVYNTNAYLRLVRSGAFRTGEQACL
jgi:hypothetical protein